MISSTTRMANRTSMLDPVENNTIIGPSLGPKMATYLGSRLLTANKGSMNMLPSIRTIMAWTAEIPPLWIMGPSIDIPTMGLAT